MNRFANSPTGPDPGLGGIAADRVDPLLGMIPAIFASIGEIHRLLSDRRKDHYTIEEFAEIVRRAPDSVRTWVRDGRVGAERPGRHRHERVDHPG
jgi:hypothetical protein